MEKEVGRYCFGDMLEVVEGVFAIAQLLQASYKSSVKTTTYYFIYKSFTWLYICELYLVLKLTYAILLQIYQIPSETWHAVIA